MLLEGGFGTVAKTKINLLTGERGHKKTADVSGVSNGPEDVSGVSNGPEYWDSEAPHRIRQHIRGIGRSGQVRTTDLRASLSCEPISRRDPSICHLKRLLKLCDPDSPFRGREELRDQEDHTRSLCGVCREGQTPASGENRSQWFKAMEAARFLDIFSPHSEMITAESLAPLKTIPCLKAYVKMLEKDPAEILVFKSLRAATFSVAESAEAMLADAAGAKSFSKHRAKADLRWTWFGTRKAELPTMSKLFFLLCLLSANSCDTERVFSCFDRNCKKGAYENSGGDRVKLAQFVAQNGVEGRGVLLCKGTESSTSETVAESEDVCSTGFSSDGHDDEDVLVIN
eukprot:scaffold1719_cov365-Pinguiococcus_pyrenoidosus.AAC.1